MYLNIINFLESLYEWFQDYPLFIRFALGTITVSVILLMLTNAGLAFQRIADTYRKKHVAKARQLVMAELTSDAMMEEKVSEQDFNALVFQLNILALKNRIFKQVVIDEIIYYHRNFTDNTQAVLKMLFSKLNLLESSVAKVQKGAWELKAKGLREIQEMPALDGMQLVSPLLNHKNHDLRIEAQAAYIRLNKDKPFEFLAETTEELLEWHQIILYELVSNTPELTIPDLKPLLLSKNISVVAFTIKLIEYHQQLSAIPGLIKLLDHEDTHLRALAVSALGRLDAEEGESKMVGKFHGEELKVQLRILKSVGEIGSGRHLDFLKEQFLQSEDFPVIKTAGCALAIYPDFDKATILDGANDVSQVRKTIINHCTNTLIRN